MNLQDRYWVGKNPQTRKAVEYYIFSTQEGKRLTYTKIAKKFGVSYMCIYNHIRNLRELQIYGKIQPSKIGRPRKKDNLLRRYWREHSKSKNKNKKEVVV